MADLTNEFQDFMNWFKLNYPDLFEKYKGNFSSSIEGDGAVFVNDNFKISKDEYDMLWGIANSYYQP